MNNILDCLREEKEMRLKGRLYHYSQIKFAYNSNKIEGSRLTEDQTRYIFETQTISTENNRTANVNDIIETVNHFRCFDYMLECADNPLSEEIIKEFHKILKQSSFDSHKEWFNIGEYKKLPNVVGEKETTHPLKVKEEMDYLINKYLNNNEIDLKKIIDFHYKFERIHPFQDGNGRVGRLIMFKECLKNNIVPFIIEDEYKIYYYMGLQEYPNSKLRLTDTCLFAQDVYKNIIKYLNEGNDMIKYDEKKNIELNINGRR